MTTAVTLVTLSNLYCCCEQVLTVLRIKSPYVSGVLEIPQKQLFHVFAIHGASQTCNYRGGIWKAQIIGPMIPDKAISKILLHWGWIFMKLLLLWLLLTRRSFFYYYYFVFVFLFFFFPRVQYQKKYMQT